MREYQTVVQLGVEDEEDIFAKSYENILLLVFLDIQENLNKEKAEPFYMRGFHIRKRRVLILSDPNNKFVQKLIIL